MAKYKYIHFVEIEITSKKYRSYECRNNKSDDVLGWVSYYRPWKQNVFTASKEWPIFNDICLLDIIDFLGKAITRKEVMDI